MGLKKGIRSYSKTGYLANIRKNVGDDPDHPYNQGIHMEAHHLISFTGVSLSGMESLLIQRGYDINNKRNLVFLPATLPGACHLAVQLHRGNHPSTSKNQNDDDNDHLENYHISVRDLLQEIKAKVKKCGDNPDASQKKTIKIVNLTSKKVLWRIKKFRSPLTKIYKNFKIGAPIGCGNCTNIPEHIKGATNCDLDRDHNGEEHTKHKGGKHRNPKTINRDKRKYPNHTLEVAK